MLGLFMILHEKDKRIERERDREERNRHLCCVCSILLAQGEEKIY